MLRLLASRLLKKKLLAAWKAARKREDEREWRAKKRRRSPGRSCLPTAATLPSAMNGDFGTSPPYKEGNPQTSRQLISHRRAWQRVRIAVNFPMPQLHCLACLKGARKRYLDQC